MLSLETATNLVLLLGLCRRRMADGFLFGWGTWSRGARDLLLAKGLLVGLGHRHSLRQKLGKLLQQIRVRSKEICDLLIHLRKNVRLQFLESKIHIKHALMNTLCANTYLEREKKIIYKQKTKQQQTGRQDTEEKKIKSNQIKQIVCMPTSAIDRCSFWYVCRISKKALYTSSCVEKRVLILLT